MPSNFYSMSLSDKYMANAIAGFAIKYFPNSKGAIILDTANCVSCHDVAQNIYQYYKNNAPQKDVLNRSFIGNNAESIHIEKLIAGWKTGYLIYSPNISYVSGVLITRVANFIGQKGLIFVGGDEWAKHEVGYIGQLKTTYPFSAYHLQDWSLNHGSKDLSIFKHFYKVIYKKEPTDPISYASFHALYSVISVLRKSDILAQKNKKNYILKQFLKYTSLHSNAFRQEYYVIYKWDHSTNKDVVASIIKVR